MEHVLWCWWAQLSTGQAVGCSIPSLFLEFMLSARISTWRSLASSSAQELITGT